MGEDFRSLDETQQAGPSMLRTRPPLARCSPLDRRVAGRPTIGAIIVFQTPVCIFVSGGTKLAPST